MVLYGVAFYGGYVGFCSKLVLKFQELHLFTADFEHFWLIGDYAGKCRLGIIIRKEKVLVLFREVCLNESFRDDTFVLKIFSGLNPNSLETIMQVL